MDVLLNLECRQPYIFKNNHHNSGLKVIYFTGVNAKSRHSNQSELSIHSMCWPCVW